MEGLAPLELEVYNKDFVYQGSVARPQALALTARHLAAGGGAFTLDADEDSVEALDAPGARLVCRYRHDPDDPYSPMHLLSGPVSQVDLGGIFRAPTRTFTVVDDWDVLNRFQTRAVPGSGWGSQGGETVYYTSSGPAETVVKDLVTQNLGINPFDITVATDLGRGESIEIQVRNNLLTDKLFPALNYAHMGISVRQSGTGLLLDAYEPTEHALPLTVASGVVAKGEGSIIRPTVSRVPVRGSDGVVREVVNTALETTWGFAGWAPVLDVSESNTASYLDAKGWEVLNAGARQVSANIELAETDGWRFGLAYNLGDEVPLELADAAVFTDVIREVEVVFDTGSGLLITPRVGEHSASPNKTLARALRQVAASQRISTARG